jgi:hypothetical protein
MNVQDWVSEIQLGSEETLANSKTTNYTYWSVIRTFEGSTFMGQEFWNGKPVENWIVAQYKNSKWKSIGYYRSAGKVYFLVKSDPYQKEWIKETSMPVVNAYADGVLTLRGLHYQMVNRGMINSITHYKRVVNAMIESRRDGSVNYYKFSDRDRQMEMLTKWQATIYEDKVEEAKNQVEAWMKNYGLNRWENQTYYPEVWIEKKALIGTFEPVTKRNRVALAACKGYPSLTFLYDASERFLAAAGNSKIPVILYFGDYDPSGEDIPRSIQDNLLNDFGISVEVRRIALMEEQVNEWNLPPAPVKAGDTRSATWDGLGQVELDAVDPKQLKILVQDAIDEIFDNNKLDELIDREEEEEQDYRKELLDHVIQIAKDSENDD